MPPNGVVSIHTSDRGTFKKCRQQWDFSSNIRGNLESIPTSMGALSFGTGIHEALAAYYTSGRLGSVVAVSVWNAYCNAQPYEVLEEGDHSRQLGINMLENYHRWAQANHKGTNWIVSELEVNLPILRLRRPLGQYPTGTVVEYSYRLDGLEQDEHDRFWLVEFKTTASFDSTYDYLLTDSQCGSYLWAEQQRRGVAIEGVHYIILKKSYPKLLRELKGGSLSVDKGQDTDYPTASAQIIKKYGEVPTQYREFLGYLLEKPNNFVRHFPVRRNQREIAAIGQALRWEIQELLDNPKIYRTDSTFNCRACPFLSPCVARWEGSDYETMLKLNYQQRKPYRAGVYA